MRLLSTWRDYLASGRVRLDVGSGIILDTEDIRPKDTGWRQLANPSGITGNIFMRRRGNDVHMMFNNVSSASAGNVNLAAIPVGFQPQAIAGANWRNGALLNDAGTTIRQASYFSGNMRCLSMPAATQMGGYLNFISSDPFPAPSAYPGNPV